MSAAGRAAAPSRAGAASGASEDLRPDAGRLTSLDAFRGIAIAGMILVNNPGSWSHVYAPLRHAEWHGWTPTDLIFPFFLFIVGVAIPFSFSKRLERGSTRTRLFGHVVRRSAILVGLGLFMAGFPDFDLSTIRIPGVLQRIGLVYLAAAGLYLGVGPRGRAWTGAGLLLGYWALMTLVPVPGHGAGDLSPDGNLAAWVDRTLLGDHLWSASETWDPEGLLSTLPAVVTALLGIHAGEWLRERGRGGRTALALGAAGAAALVLGLLWGRAFPINKNLWTSSYVLATGGVAGLFLGGLHWVVDVRRREAWARPFVHYGMNAIAVFVASGLVTKTLFLWRVADPSAPGTTSAYHRIYETAFASWAGPLNGSLAFAVTYVLLWYGVAALLYRRRIFIKI